MISDAHKNDIGNNDDDDDDEEEEDDPGETNVSLACHMYCLLRLHCRLQSGAAKSTRVLLFLHWNTLQLRTFQKVLHFVNSTADCVTI